jgi:hypothetical protein
MKRDTSLTFALVTMPHAARLPGWLDADGFA